MSETHPFRDRAAIVGVGPHRVLEELGCQHAHAGAARDPGGARRRRAHALPTSTAWRATASATPRRPRSSRSRSGMRDPRFFLDLFGGGSASHAVVGSAAMAVATGHGRLVVCWRAVNARSRVPHGRHRAAAARRGRVPVPDAVRLRDAAAAVRDDTRVPTCDDYGVTPEDLGRVAITQRDYAHAQRPRDDALPAHHGRLPRVAVDRRAAPAVRLLPRDRRRGRGGRHDAGAGARPRAHAGR